MFYEGETKYRGIFLVAFAFGASPLRGILSGFRKNLDDLSLIKPAEKGSRQLRSTSLVAFLVLLAHLLANFSRLMYV